MNILPSLCLALVLAVPAMAADAHAGHSHAEHSHAEHSHGSEQALGSLTVGPTTIAVSAAGAVTAGAEWHVELTLTPATPAPKAIRVWVGSESGRGSVKAKAQAEEPGECAAHVEVPKPLPADAALWISVEAADGQVTKHRLALPAAHK